MMLGFASSAQPTESTILLADACRRVHQASNLLGVYAVLADALNDQAKAFYRHHGFIALPDSSRVLFLPLATWAKKNK